MHRIMAREREIGGIGEIGVGMKQKEITISVGCVATGKCQNVKWLGKDSCGECTLSSLGRPLWGESRKPRGNRTVQDRTRDHLGVGGGTRRV